MKLLDQRTWASRATDRPSQLALGRLTGKQRVGRTSSHLQTALDCLICIACRCQGQIYKRALSAAPPTSAAAAAGAPRAQLRQQCTQQRVWQQCGKQQLLAQRAALVAVAARGGRHGGSGQHEQHDFRLDDFVSFDSEDEWEAQASIFVGSCVWHLPFCWQLRVASLPCYVLCAVY